MQPGIVPRAMDDIFNSIAVVNEFHAQADNKSKVSVTECKGCIDFQQHVKNTTLFVTNSFKINNIIDEFNEYKDDITRKEF